MQPVSPPHDSLDVSPSDSAGQGERRRPVSPAREEARSVIAWPALLVLACAWLVAGCLPDLQQQVINTDNGATTDEGTTDEGAEVDSTSDDTTDSGDAADTGDTAMDPGTPVVPCEGTPPVAPFFGICESLVELLCDEGEWRWQVKEGLALPDGFQENGETSCDGVDNDCDGATDERDDLVMPDDLCASEGVCGEAADRIRTACTDGVWVCDYTGVPGYEDTERSCDTRDNDCDGEVDEGISVSNGLGCLPLGLCAVHESVCDNGTWSCQVADAAAYEPDGETLCDGKDNDCDGLTDEDLTQAPSGLCPTAGVCAGLVDELREVCVDGAYACDFDAITGYEAGGEVSCDGLDNDCDGETDEELDTPPAEFTCVAPGLCRNGGTASCEGGEWSCDYSAVQFYEEGDETLCDAKDNDCDGLTDEEVVVDNPPDCLDQGVCAAPAVITGNCIYDVRTKTSRIVCDYSQIDDYQAARETLCDNLDNNCDGETDENLQDTAIPDFCPNQGVCEGRVTGSCTAGEATCDFSGIRTYEADDETLCDAKDNDCDGQVDEGLEGSMDNDCPQVGVCAADQNGPVLADCATDAGAGTAAWECKFDQIVGYEAEEQSCDQLDNDCDGLTDENLSDLDASSCKKTGVCTGNVVVACASGRWICDYGEVAGYQGEREGLCDGLDNDCDGATDEGTCLAGQPCSGDDDDRCLSGICKPAFAGGPRFCVRDFNDCVTPLADGTAAVVSNGAPTCASGSQTGSCNFGVIEAGDLCDAANPVCDAGVCRVCKPSAQFCDGRDIMACNDDGTGSEKVGECGADQACVADGFCVASGEVAPHVQVTDNQNHPTLGILPNDEGFLLAWFDRRAEGDAERGGIVARFFDDAGAPLAARPDPFLVNAFPSNGAQDRPSIAINHLGTTFIAWESKVSVGDTADSIEGKVYLPNKLARAEHFLVNQFTSGAQTKPSVAAMTDGRFVVAWASTARENAGANGDDVHLRIYPSDGNPANATDEVVVNTSLRSFQTLPRVVGLANGNVLAAWLSFDATSLPAGITTGIVGRLLNTEGVFATDEFVINQGANGNITSSHACGVASNSAFVCAWEGVGSAGADIYGRLLSNDDAAQVTATAVVNDEPIPGQSRAQTEPWTWRFPGGGYGVAWEAENIDGQGLGLYYRLYTSGGLPTTAGSRQINVTTLSDQKEVRCGAFARGHFVCAWTSNNQDGGGDGVYFRLFDR